MPTTAERAIENAHDVQRYPRGDRLRLAREQWEVGPLYPSAIEAWNGARWKHPGDRTPPPGAPCFYAGGNYGHICDLVPAGPPRDALDRLPEQRQRLRRRHRGGLNERGATRTLDGPRT